MLYTSFYRIIFPKKVGLGTRDIIYTSFTMMRLVNPTKIAEFRASIRLTRIAALSSQNDSNTPKVQNFINGQFVDSKTTKWIPLYNPGKTIVPRLLQLRVFHNLRPKL